MPLTGELHGMAVSIDDLDTPNQEFFKHCGHHQLHLQCCDDCKLMRYPATNACPHCGGLRSIWQPVSGKGTLYSYGEIHHAIQPAFRPFTPYMLLLVELDEQRNEPNEFDGLRMTGNLVTESGEMAPSELVNKVGIGSRLKIVFVDMGSGIAQPQWTLDDGAEQPESVWRYPD